MNDNVALIVRLALAGVFAVAAIGKLLDPRGSRAAAESFSVPAAVAPVVAIALPIAEAAIAIALVPASVARFGAVGALALLAAFIAAISVALARGRRPDCHCFGQLHRAPIGAGILVRNLVLGAGAIAVIAAGGGTSLPAWWDGLSAPDRTVAVVAGGLGVIVLAEGAMLWKLFVSYGRLLVRIDDLEASGSGGAAGRAGAPAPSGTGLPIGAVAPPFALPGLHGETNTLAALLARSRPVLLIFTDPQCGPCGVLTPEIATWQTTLDARLTVAVISRGPADDNVAKFSTAGVGGVLLQQDRETSDAYLSPGTPSAVLVDVDGRIASDLGLGIDGIRALVERVSGVPWVPVVLGNRVDGNGNGNGNGHGHDHGMAAAAVAATVGDAAPDVRLPDLDGRDVELTSFRGRDLLLMFWNPQCGFCEQLLPQILEWEAERDGRALEPVIVTTGSIEANRALGFRSTVLFDESFIVGPRFGASGTPIAVVIDADGNIASELAIGGPAIMELTGRL